MKQSVWFLLPAIIGFTSLLNSPVSAGTSPYASIQGTWGFLDNNTYSGEYVADGTLTFDGFGNVTGVMNFAAATFICAGASMAGTYSVNPDKLSGTATMTLSSVGTSTCAEYANGDKVNIIFYLGNNRRLMNFIENDENEEGTFGNDFDTLAGVATHF